MSIPPHRLKPIFMSIGGPQAHVNSKSLPWQSGHFERCLTADHAHGAPLTGQSTPLPRLVPQRVDELPDFVALAVDLLCGFLRQLAMDSQLLF